MKVKCMNERNPVIIFDDSVKSKVVNSLGFKKDADSKLLDKNGKIATSQDFESISFDEFGGILKGSKIAIKKKDSELVRYFISTK